MPNTATATLEIPQIVCNHFDISTKGDATQIGNPLYTAKGIVKPTDMDPVRSLDWINKIITWISHQGHKTTAYRDSTLFYFGINTGLRYQSISSLYVGDLLKPDDTLADRFIVYEGKTHKRNSRPITPEMKAVLGPYIQALNLQRTDRLFPILAKGQRHKMLNRHNYYQKLRDCQTAIGLPNHFGTHSMRKTFGYWIVKTHPADLDTMNCLMKLFNHASMGTTLNYVGVTRDQTDDMCSELSTFFSTGNAVADNSMPDSDIDQIINILTKGENEDDN